jgi:serine/threonine protein kinase
MCDSRSYIESKYGPAFDEEPFTSALTAAVEHLHCLGLAHNDINPANILLTEDQMPVLADFNSCHPIGEKLELSRGTEGCIDTEDSWDTSETHHDFFAIEKIRESLKEAREKWPEDDTVTDTQNV